MQAKKDFKNVEAYIKALPEERQEVINQLRTIIKQNLPAGFQEGIGYGMIAFFVPHSIYPQGYHADPSNPLPFINIASQKNHVALYHLGLYSNKKLLTWFKQAYAKRCKHKPDMGKSCIRFRKLDDIPSDLIGELAAKITVHNWIEQYESMFSPK